MARWLQRLRDWLAPAPASPEDAVARALTGMRRHLTEARLQVAAARGAERQAGRADPSPELIRLEAGLRDLEERVSGAESRRQILVAALQRARAEERVQRALMEVQRMDTGLAFDTLEAAARDAEASARAVADLGSRPRTEPQR